MDLVERYKIVMLKETIKDQFPDNPSFSLTAVSKHIRTYLLTNKICESVQLKMKNSRSFIITIFKGNVRYNLILVYNEATNEKDIKFF